MLSIHTCDKAMLLSRITHNYDEMGQHVAIIFDYGERFHQSQKKIRWEKDLL